MKIWCKDYTLNSFSCWCIQLHNWLHMQMKVYSNRWKYPKRSWIIVNFIGCCLAAPTINYGILLLNLEQQSQGGLRAGRYMTTAFTHFWFSKWIFPSWHYWSESQYNECLPWRWHRGGLILPQNELVLKYSTFCTIDPDFGMSACMYISKHFKRLSSNKSRVEAVVSNYVYVPFTQL